MVTEPGHLQQQVSVALCTCNGQIYIEEQIKSILEQTYSPIEIIVCDDASDDNTVQILEKISTTSSVPIRIKVNDQRQGIEKNYEQAISLASGNIISLCDQDDVWLPEKLEKFVDAFTNGAQWVCCDAEIVDENLKPLGYSLWDRVGFNEKERLQANNGEFFSILLKHSVVAGATIAFREELRNRILPVAKNWLYDGWFAVILAATSEGLVIETPLQYYRQHSGNVIGANRKSLLSEMKNLLSLDRTDYYREEISKWSAISKNSSNFTVLDKHRHQLQEKIAHLNRRAALPRNRIKRIPMVMSEIFRGGYANFARNSGSVAIDLLIR